MIISHKYQFIFIKTAKTAGTSIETYLSPHCGADDVVTPIYPPEPGHEPKNFRGLFNPIGDLLAGIRPYEIATMLRARWRYSAHMAAFQVRHRLPRDIWDSYTKWCVERNPWDKVVSDFNFRNSLQRHNWNVTFEQYIQGCNFPHNAWRYTEPRQPRQVIVDRVLRFESLNEELGKLFGELGVPFEGELSARAKSQHRDRRKSTAEYFDAASSRVVAEAFADEIALFGYEPPTLPQA